MKILLVHNRYQLRGGEDFVFEEESALLERHGHHVIRCEVSNDEIKDYSAFQRFLFSGRTTWSSAGYRMVERLARQEKPDVAHFHNTLPLISPAGYYAARRHGCAVVQTLHNYRLTCLNGLLLREGRPCEACVGKAAPWPGVAHACYRGSRAASAAVATMLTTHRALRTWVRQVDTYIALTPFARQKFIDAGLPADKIVVKPNFVDPDPGPTTNKEDYAVFVGRLSAEKGLDVLLEAWQKLGARMRLKIAGDGPLADAVQEAMQANPHIEWLGQLPYNAVLDTIGRAAFLVFPSIGYETFGRTAVEAFAKATPVLASNRGAVAGIVEHERTGLLFRPGDAEDLAAKASWLLDHPAEREQMGKESRAVFETTYSAEHNYKMLLEIYETAITHARSRAQLIAS